MSARLAAPAAEGPRQRAFASRILAAGEAARFLIHSVFLRFSPQTFSSPANRLNVGEILQSGGRQFRGDQVFTGNEVRLPSIAGSITSSTRRPLPHQSQCRISPSECQCQTAHVPMRNKGPCSSEIGCRQALKRRSKFCQSHEDGLRVLHAGTYQNVAIFGRPRLRVNGDGGGSHNKVFNKVVNAVRVPNGQELFAVGVHGCPSSHTPLG